jgi:tetratricopeptide (TPR) repeat protein
LWLASAWLGACGTDGGDASDGPRPVAAAGTQASAPAAAGFSSEPRVMDPALVRLRAALEFGRLEEVDQLLPRAASAGAEEAVLRARALALRGSRIDALRILADQAAARPLDPEPRGAAAEIYAASGAFEDALREILALERVSKTDPVVLRARGVAMLCKDGGAASGLDLLTRARAADPSLPYCDRALAQAHLLVGKEAAKRKDLPAALEHAEASTRFDPDEVDAQRFHSECLAAAGRFAAARAILDALAARGVPLGAEVALLEKRAGFDALLRGEREEALARFVAARAAGLDADGLGSAAELLVEAAEQAVEEGVRLFGEGDIDEAAARFALALQRDPAQLSARNHLAVCRLRQGRPSEAAPLWREVLAMARAEGLELPEPVHLNLAHALSKSGDADGARAALRDYLGREPEGRWVAETERALAALGGPSGG